MILTVLSAIFLGIGSASTVQWVSEDALAAEQSKEPVVQVSEIQLDEKNRGELGW